MKLQPNLHFRRQAGYSALFITLVLVGATVLMLGATLNRTSSNVRLNDRNCLYIAANGAAEAAVEKVLSRLMVDFMNSGESLVLTNLSFYSTSLLPTSAENSYWTNYNWSDAQGHNNQIYVARTTVGANAPYVALEQQYAGLSGYASTYRILANVTLNNSTYNYNFTNAVQQDVQLAQIPVFQFAIFYNGLLEFSDTATLNVTGPVHANSNIYVGSPANLTFNSIVTTTGNITAPANAGYSVSTWSGTTTYNGSPTPGYLTGQPSLTLPIGTTSLSGTNVQQILYPPPAGELYSSPMGQQRYYNKADMTLLISNTTFTVNFKSAPNDGTPWGFTSNLTYLTNVNWNWISTTTSFKDWRENKTVNVTQIDVGKMTNWMAHWLTTNTVGVASKYSVNNPFNIIYVVDYRTTNSSTLTAIRLYNGVNLPNTGLTVATPNPLYIQGYYNCPNSAYLGLPNTTASAAASVACDALTILSPNWSDGSSLLKALNQTAKSDTVNTAIITGIVASTGTGSSQYSGGANNLPRLLEDWSNFTLTLNTSIVCLFNSTWATGQFILPGNYYYAPGTRNFSFDQNYTTAAGMPPGTPNICRMIRANWCNPPPGVINYSNVTDFVAR